MLKRLWVTNDFIENCSSIYLDGLYINPRKEEKIVYFFFYAVPASSGLYLIVLKRSLKKASQPLKKVKHTSKT